MEKTDINAKIREFHAVLPRFPDGRINFSESDSATVMNVFVKFRNKVLLLKRSDKVRAYKGLWNSIGGYLDDLKPLREKVLEELWEEIGVEEKDIKEIALKEVYTYADASINKTWITQIVVVELKAIKKIRLDWEHTQYRWIEPEELKNYDIVPHLEVIAKKALGA